MLRWWARYSRASGPESEARWCPRSDRRPCSA